ncbi:unnamed protein product [Closterium sp. Yama58-4]|nr:unnamed protein product [Closterium sp. Yama58-4]
MDVAGFRTSPFMAALMSDIWSGEVRAFASHTMWLAGYVIPQLSGFRALISIAQPRGVNLATVSGFQRLRLHVRLTCVLNNVLQSHSAPEERGYRQILIRLGRTDVFDSQLQVPRRAIGAWFQQPMKMLLHPMSPVINDGCDTTEHRLQFSNPQPSHTQQGEPIGCQQCYGPEMTREDLAALRDQLNAELLRHDSNPAGPNPHHQSFSQPRTPETAEEQQLNDATTTAAVADARPHEPETQEDNTLNPLIDEGEGKDDAYQQDEGDGHPDECELAEVLEDQAEDDRPESRRRSAAVADIVGAVEAAHESGRVKRLSHQHDPFRSMKTSHRTATWSERSRIRPTRPGPSSSNSGGPPAAGVGMLHASARRSSPLTTTNANRHGVVPIVREGAAIPPVLLDLSFFKLKCNAAVNYFIGEAPAREQSFYPTLSSLRRKFQELYEDVGVPSDMFNTVMADNPEREKIPMQKMSERRCNIFSASKPYAHGPGGYITENKVPMLAAENLAPTRRRTASKWHAFFRDDVYGSKWHCDGSGRPFANRSFELALCKGLGGKRCNRLNVKIQAVATICHVVEWPMANHNGHANPSLDASDENNRAAVAAKILVVIAWIKARLEADDDVYNSEAPAGFVMGRGAVKILIEGFEAEFDGLV